MQYEYYSPYFIGYPASHKNTNFSGSDSEEKFLKSKSEKEESWEYNSMPISYIRNEYGHRSGKITELNLDNYILFTGCSITEGIGIPVESRYSNLLSDMLKCDIYNLGLGGTGNDIIFYNLMSWFSIIKTKPKLVVLQWTSEYRYAIIDKENTSDVSIYGPWNEPEKNFLIEGSNNGYFVSKKSMFEQLIKKVIDVPIIEIIPHHVNRKNEPTSRYQLFTPMKELLGDVARDLSHPGIKSNKMLSEKLFNLIKKEELL